jgi:hypothetical protein
MIIKAYKYKGYLSDARRLNEHLWKDEGGQRPELSETRHLYAADTLAGMRVMQSLQRGSRAKIAFWHISVSPTTTLDASDRTRVVNLIIRELKAEAHPLIVLSHNEKPRARRGGGAGHFHCVLGHVSPTTGLALDMRNHVQRLQKVAAIAAFDMEGQTSVSSYHRSIVTHLSREGRPDVARWLTDLARKASPLQQPRMTDAMRRSAAAVGFELPSFQARLQRLWNSDASEQAFDDLLSEAGVTIRRGDRSPDSILLYRGDLLVGVLNRILRQPRSLVYEEASVRFPGLFGKPRIVGDISKSGPTSRIEKLRQETTDRLDVMLRRMRTKILVLTYNPPHPKKGPEGNKIPIAEQLQKLAEGEAIFNRAIDLLWSDDHWVSMPIEKLLGYSKHVLSPDPPSRPVSGTTGDMESNAKQPTDDSAVVFDEDEVLEYQPFGLKI